MIIEGRTITTVAELQEFCAAAVAATHADPATIRLHVAQDMRIAETTRTDGRKVYDVLISSAG
jgi:D-alanyl-D-alanine dipeptidase